MATHDIVRSFHGMLPLMGGVDIITSSEARSQAVVFNRGPASIYVRMDGTSPSQTGANDGDLVVPSETERAFSFVDANAPEIRLAATANLAYSVEIY